MNEALEIFAKLVALNRPLESLINLNRKNQEVDMLRRRAMMRRPVARLLPLL